MTVDYDTSYPPSLWQQPVGVSVTPTSVAQGGTVTITLEGVAPWHVTFGDGSPAVDTSSPTITHTYAAGVAAGSKTVTVKDATAATTTTTVTVTAAP